MNKRRKNRERRSEGGIKDMDGVKRVEERIHVKISVWSASNMKSVHEIQLIKQGRMKRLII